MKQGRLPWLLAIAAVLLLLRWFAPLQPASKAVDIVLPSEAVVSPSVSSGKLEQAALPAVASAAHTPASNAEPSRVGVGAQVEQGKAVDASMGNAFAVRSPPVPDTPPPPTPPVAQVQAAAPPPVMAEATVPPPPPPPPPLQVIGTWDDGVSPGVFISTPQATVLARKDTVLMSDYRVVSIGAGTVSLLQLSSQSPWSLAIPQNAPPAHAPNRPAPAPPARPQYRHPPVISP
jgi:hypothetical protein